MGLNTLLNPVEGDFLLKYKLLQERISDKNNPKNNQYPTPFDAGERNAGSYFFG
jgi:hypothetical protein